MMRPAQAMLARFGNDEFIQLTGAIGYYSLLCMTVNACELEAAVGSRGPESLERRPAPDSRRGACNGPRGPQRRSSAGSMIAVSALRDSPARERTAQRVQDR